MRYRVVFDHKTEAKGVLAYFVMVPSLYKYLKDKFVRNEIDNFEKINYKAAEIQYANHPTTNTKMTIGTNKVKGQSFIKEEAVCLFRNINKISIYFKTFMMAIANLILVNKQHTKTTVKPAKAQRTYAIILKVLFVED